MDVNGFTHWSLGTASFHFHVIPACAYRVPSPRHTHRQSTNLNRCTGASRSEPMWTAMSNPVRTHPSGIFRSYRTSCQILPEDTRSISSEQTFWTNDTCNLTRSDFVANVCDAFHNTGYGHPSSSLRRRKFNQPIRGVPFWHFSSLWNMAIVIR
jgi:hypothetical protein